jgi:adenine-specific DNA-methyltransferase
MTKKTKLKKTIESISHKDAARRNIPTAEYQSIMQKGDLSPIQVAYERRNRDLDPQLVWRGKDEQDGSDLVVQAPPLYIQEKVNSKVLIDDLKTQSGKSSRTKSRMSLDLFADFNGLPSTEAKTEFYQHDQNWSNRMILGDSLQVMSSLTEREGLRGKVQCVYIDPPYGIKFNSNFQWSTTSTSVTDGKAGHITREPEQVKAYRDTWRDGIHSYLTYLRDRLTIARDLLSNTGSIFIQIGSENVHRVRSLMDEIFGEDNFISQISYKTTQSSGSTNLDSSVDYILWYSKSKESVIFNNPLVVLQRGDKGATRYNFAENTDTGEIRGIKSGSQESFGKEWRYFTDQGLTSRGSGSENTMRKIAFQNKSYLPSAGHWRTSADLIERRLIPAGRVIRAGKTIRFKKCFDDFGCISLTNLWEDVGGGIQSRNDPKIYVVQTSTSIIQRCILMATNPGDLVLDPTCGAGTTAMVAEQWGRRWITIDTSRVALTLSRSRIMGARYPYYLLADSPEGQIKEASLSDSYPSNTPTHQAIRYGFVHERVRHVFLKSIAMNSEIEEIWNQYQSGMETLRENLNKSLGVSWEEWEVPFDVEEGWAQSIKADHTEWWKKRVERQKEIDNSIASNADVEYLFDKPYEDKKKVRVAGPFTVESISPHRVVGVDADGELIDPNTHSALNEGEDFVGMIMENLKRAGVQQSHKDTKIDFTSLEPWPGIYICAEGKFFEGSEETGAQKRAAILIGPEFGTVSRPDLVAAAREAGDADFDVLITCAFNYDAHAADFDKLGRIPVLKARMNADLHMADDLKNTGKGNLFVIFGEPDIDILKSENDQIQVQVNGVDVFHPNTGEIHSNNTDEIACWFIDTDYNEESFFVRHAYFLGAKDPYKSLKTTLRAEINEDAWESLHSAISRPFDKPESGRIAVKVINHLGDEVMKVYSV